MIGVLCLLAGPVHGQSDVGRNDSFTDSTGRTLLYRYWVRSGWDLTVPRGVVLYLHGNSRGTAEQLRGSRGWGIRDALDRGLAVVVPASPFSLPEELTWGERSLVGPSIGRGGTRFWGDSTDARLVHELLQSGLNSRLAIDYERVVFSGGSQGTCFLAAFLEYYGGSYGGGFHAHCGCFWLDFDGDDSHDTYAATPPFAASPWSATFQWTPFATSTVRDRFRVFVEATTDDFLHPAAVSMSRYYSEWLGLETRSDLEASGGHCARGFTGHGEIIDWLSSGTVPGPLGGGADTDGDGTPDAADLDDDNDGAPDFLDALPRDRRDWRDTDGDGIADARDRDADGDGVGNASDAFPLNSRERLDTDGDGIGNRLDADDDNDGLPDTSDPQPLVGADNGDRLAFVLNREGGRVVGRRGYTMRPRAKVHRSRPSGVAYPAARGHAQSYQFVELGNTSDPRFEIMVDRFVRREPCQAVLVPQLCAITRFSWGGYYSTYYQNLFDRIWIDKNRNRDLRDDGPPLLVASNAALARSDGSNFNPYTATAVLEVPYATGQVLPYAIVVEPGRRISDGIVYSAASVWKGNVGTPSGERVSAIVVDGDVDGLFDSQDEDFVCVDLDRNGWLNECEFSENGVRARAIAPFRLFEWEGDRYSLSVSAWGREVTVVKGRIDPPPPPPQPPPPPPPPSEGCAPTTAVLRFDGGYEVKACFEYEQDGETVESDAFDYGLESDESGLLYFFDRDNAEVLIKVLNGCGVNGHRWVFVAPVTDLALNLEIREVATGRRWEYGNPGGKTADTASDTTAFPCHAAAASWAPSGGGRGGSVDGLVGLRGSVPARRTAAAAAETDCTPEGPALTLRGGYQVSMCYETYDGAVGQARDWGLDSSQSALLYFFDRDNVEVLIKVLDGCGVNGHRWVFVAPVTDLAFNLHVESPSGERWTHRNRLGQIADAASDVSAFPCASSA